jgi:hypothetical protein
MQGVLAQSEAMRANVATANASHVFTAKTSDVAAAAKASDVTSTAKTAAHMAAAPTAKTSAVTTATATATAAAGVGRACQQARSEKSCCQYRDHPFHRDTPFSQIARRHDARTSTSHANDASDG